MIGIPVQNSEKLPQLILLPQLHPPGKEILISVLLPSPKTDGLGQLPCGWNIPKPCGLCPEGWPAEDPAYACWGPAVVNNWSCYETQKDHRYRYLKYNFKHTDVKKWLRFTKIDKENHVYQGPWMHHIYYWSITLQCRIYLWFLSIHFLEPEGDEILE